MKRLESRLAKLETKRREADARRDNPNRPKHTSELLGGPYDPSITLPRLLESSAKLPSIPPDDDPDYLPENVVDVDSAILKIQGDRDGWKQRQLFLKRDLAEMVRRDWPDIDAEPREAATRNNDDALRADGYEPLPPRQTR